MLSDNPGPRAVLNALERLVDGYERERDDSRTDLTVVRWQPRDYEGRIGKMIEHAD